MSYTALESYRRCGYRFYLERRLGLVPAAGVPGERSEASAREAAALSALERGSVAHKLLERVDLRRPDQPSRQMVAACLEARGAAASSREVDELVRLVDDFVASALATRLARAARLRRELPFAFPLEVTHADGRARSVLVEGVLDAHCREGTSALVVDYKTDRIAPDADLEALCDDAYATQRLVYALAALRDGAEEVEVAHVFLERPDEPVLARFAAADADAIERRLGLLVGDMIAGRYEPSAAPGPALCRGCPGRSALCSWPPERTGAGPARA